MQIFVDLNINGWGFSMGKESFNVLYLDHIVVWFVQASGNAAELEILIKKIGSKTTSWLSITG